MSDIEKNIDQNIKPKRIVDRSPAYPSIDLKAAVDLGKKLFDLFSDYGFSRETASEKLVLAKNANTFRKIAALVQYGLLKREGNKYIITKLAKDIVLSTDDGLKIKLLGTAVRQPKIYGKLITENSGKALPLSLDTRLRQLEYSKNAAKSLATIFKHSLEYSGVLKNGILIVSSEDPKKQEVKVEDGPKQGSQIESLHGIHAEMTKPLTIQPDVNSGKYIPYPLDCGIVVMFPYSKIKKIMSGTFLKKLAELEDLGKEEVNGSSSSDAPNTSVE